MTATVVGKMASQLICGIPVLGEAAASNRTVTLTALYADVDLVTPREDDMVAADAPFASVRWWVTLR